MEFGPGNLYQIFISSVIILNGVELSQRCRCPNNGLFVIAILLLVLFLVAELTLRVYNLYRQEPMVDIPSHFFAGMAIFAGVLWVTSLTRIKWRKPVTFGLTFLVALLWEVLEKLQEMIIVNPPHLIDIFFWDGVGDIIFTIIGGVFGLLLIYLVKKGTSLLDDVAV